jgi:hypothetical protein
LEGSVSKNQLIESHNRDMKWGEIPSEARMDPAAPIWIELDYTATKNGSSRYRDPVLDVDWIKQATSQWLPSLHGYVLRQLNREGSCGRNLD